MKATEEQIKTWKKQYDCKIFEFTAKQEGEEDKHAYFRAITPEVLEAWNRIREKSEIQANEVWINSCWIAGDEEIKTRNEYRLALYEHLGVLLYKAEAEMVEL
jgi:hypothetical protein